MTQPSQQSALRESSANHRPARSAAVRAALVEEAAAQRDELLAKTADEISRAAQSASRDARQRELKQVDRASREAAAQIAAENLRRAVAARVAAANKRQAAENQPNNSGVGSSKSEPGNRNDVGGSGSGSGGSGQDGGGGGVSPVPERSSAPTSANMARGRATTPGLTSAPRTARRFGPSRAGSCSIAGNSGDWAGNHVAIKHADGMTTMYSHMSSMAVRAGQSVSAGQVVGRVGETGRAFEPTCTSELYPAGVKYGDVHKAINPQPRLRLDRGHYPLAAGGVAANRRRAADAAGVSGGARIFRSARSDEDGGNRANMQRAKRE